MGESTIAMKTSAASGASGKKIASAKQKPAGIVDFKALNNRPQKWTFSSRIKNFLDPERKQRKLAERNELAKSVESASLHESKLDLEDGSEAATESVDGKQARVLKTTVDSTAPNAAVGKTNTSTSAQPASEPLQEQIEKRMNEILHAKPEKKSVKGMVRGGTKKLQRVVTSAAKQVGDTTGLVSSEEAKRRRQLLPPQFADRLTDRQTEQVFVHLRKPVESSNQELVKLFRGHEPTEASINDPRTYLTGYASGRRALIEGHDEKLLASGLFRRLEVLERGGEKNFEQRKPIEGLKSFTFAEVKARAEKLADEEDRTMLLNFLDGVRRAYFSDPV